MNAKVMELIEELGFTIKGRSPLYGVEDGIIFAEKEGWEIRVTTTAISLRVNVTPVRYTCDEAVFNFVKGRRPSLHFNDYTPELFEIARRFGEVAGCAF